MTAAGRDKLVNAAKPNILRGQLTDKYVGHAGIHGIGIRMSNDQPVVYVYVEKEQPTQALMVQQLAAEASPYKVIVVTEKIPQTGLPTRRRSNIKGGSQSV